VRFAAQIIEAQLFQGLSRRSHRAFHRSAEYLDSLMEAKAVFDHRAGCWAPTNLHGNSSA
jgi:hypothetical protein